MKKLKSSINARIPEILELKDVIIAGKEEEVLKLETVMKESWSGIAGFNLLMRDFYVSEGNAKEPKRPAMSEDVVAVPMIKVAIVDLNLPEKKTTPDAKI